MDIQAFGRALLDTRDLDPVYVGLAGAKLGPDQMARWLLAYWCFYHVGSASLISEQTGADYWRLMRVAAENTQPAVGGGRWPRAAERRHFRGQKCVDAVEWLSNHDPEFWVKDYLTTDKHPHGTSEHYIMDRVQEWPMFGPWIAFKAADMMERVWGLSVAFDRNLGLMYETPRAALDLLASTSVDGAYPRTRDEWYNHLIQYFFYTHAPPRDDRPCGPQEVETILCKWKSHMGGHYWVGKDIHEQRQALAGWGDTAGRILKAYPQEVPAQRYA